MDSSYASVQPVGGRGISNLWGLTNVPCLSMMWKDSDPVGESDFKGAHQCDQGIESEFEEGPDSEVQPETSADIETQLGRMHELRMATSKKLLEIENDILSAQQHASLFSDLESEVVPDAGSLVCEMLPPSQYEHLLPSTASPAFNKNRILSSIKIIKDLTPSIHDLNSLYLSLVEGTADADGLCIDSQEDLLDISGAITKLLSDVLELPTTEDALQKCSNSFTDYEHTDGTQLTTAQMKISQQVLCAKIDAITSNISTLDEFSKRMATVEAAPCSSLLSHQQQILQKIKTASSQLSHKSQVFKDETAQRCTEKTKTLETAEHERAQALDDIQQYRKLIDDKFKVVLSRTATIKHLEMDLSKQQQLLGSVETVVADVAKKLDDREQSCEALIKLCNSLTHASKQVTTIGTDYITHGHRCMNELLHDTHTALYTEVAKHWKMVIEDKKKSTEDLRTAKRLFEQETGSIKVQRKMGVSTSMLQLQEQLLSQREELITQRRHEIDNYDKELTTMSDLLNTYDTLSVLSAPSGRSHKGQGTTTATKDFRLPYYEDLKNSEARDQLEQIQDLLCLACDLKAGVTGISSNHEPLDQLLEQLMSLDYRGSLPAVIKLINSDPDTKKSIQLLHSVLSETLKAIPQSEASSTRSTFSLLKAVKTKVGALLEQQDGNEVREQSQ